MLSCSCIGSYFISRKNTSNQFHNRVSIWFPVPVKYVHMGKVFRLCENNYTSINMSLGARGHSFGSRDFKMVVSTTSVPRPFSYDDLNFFEGWFENTPLPVYGNMAPPPIPLDFQLLSVTNKKVQIQRVFPRFTRKKKKKKEKSQLQ